MRSWRVGLGVFLLAACASQPKAQTRTEPTSAPSPVAGSGIEHTAEATAEPEPLSRSQLLALLSSGDDAAIDAALARVGLRYLSEGEPGLAARLDDPEVAPNKQLPANSLLARAASDHATGRSAGLDACPQYFEEPYRNAWFKFNGEWYRTDSEGRPLEAYTELPPIQKEARAQTCQREVGRWGDASGTGDYDGGHMIGSQLGGYGKRINMVPQETDFNQVHWVKVENRMAGCYQLAKKRFRYWVAVTYPNSTTLVPSRMLLYIEDTADGEAIELEFDNAVQGQDGIDERERGVKFLEERGCLARGPHDGAEL